MEPLQVKDNFIVVYMNGLAHVGTSVSDVKTDNIQITGIPHSIMPESLHTILGSKDVQILEARTLKPTTLEDIARNQIDRPIRKVEQMHRPAHYHVVGVENDRLLVQHDSISSIQAHPLTDFAYNAQDIRTEPAIELKLKQKRSVKPLEMAYLTRGIALGHHYNIILSEGKLSLAAEAEVKNKTGKPFENIELEILPGEVGTPYLPSGGSHRAIKRIMGMGVVGEAELMDEVDVFEEKGQVGYSFGKRDLPEGRTRFGVFKLHDLDYEVIYKANITHSAKIGTTLRFKTPTTLPVGSVAVYGEKPIGGELTERYEGGGAIHAPALKDSDVEIKLRTPDTLKLKVEPDGEPEIVLTDLGTKEAPVYAVETAYIVTVTNAGYEDAALETRLSLNNTEKVLAPTLEPSESKRGRVKWDIPIKSGNTKTFSYKIQDAKFMPAPRGSIENRQNPQSPPWR